MRACVIFTLLFSLITIYLSSTSGMEEDSSLGELASAPKVESFDTNTGVPRKKRSETNKKEKKIKKEKKRNKRVSKNKENNQAKRGRKSITGKGEKKGQTRKAKKEKKEKKEKKGLKEKRKSRKKDKDMKGKKNRKERRNKENNKASKERKSSARREKKKARMTDKGKKAIKKKRKSRKKNNGMKADNNKKGRKSSSRRGKKMTKLAKKAQKARKAKKEKGKTRKRNKDKKGKNKRKERKTQTRSGSNDTALCFKQSMTIMKMWKDTIQNFQKQKIRMEKQNATAINKFAKKNVFVPTFEKLMFAGGLNKQNLSCNGSTTNAGAVQIKNLTDTLFSCYSNINTACNTSSWPQPNMNKVSHCDSLTKHFKKGAEACLIETINKANTDIACACWTGSNLNKTVQDVRQCKFSDEAAKIKKAFQKCTEAFSKCRKYEDAAISPLTDCKPNFVSTASGNTGKFLG